MGVERVEGTVLKKFPANTNTDEIISGKYKYDELDMKKLAVHTFESVCEGFYEAARRCENPIIVAYENFGCGSSREQAPAVLKECGIACIIAPSFARIFFRNSINIGLPLVEVSKSVVDRIDEGDRLNIDFVTSKIMNISKKEEYEFKTELPDFLRDILKEGLVEFLRKHGFPVKKEKKNASETGEKE